MVPDALLAYVHEQILQHCQTSKGYEEGPWVNPLVPADCVAAFAMANWLIDQQCFDVCVSVAPEGHGYGHFFELRGIYPLSVPVDYPPQKCTMLDDLSEIENRRVMILEDDVVSGITLQLTTNALASYKPAEESLYLGRRKEDQFLDNVPSTISQIYLASDTLAAASRSKYEKQFIEFFTTRLGGSQLAGLEAHPSASTTSKCDVYDENTASCK